MSKINDLFLTWKIPDHLLFDLRFAVGNYIAKALHFDFNHNELAFIAKLNLNRNNRTNVTPNGGVVPKKEYALEYNTFIRAWCEIIREMTKNDPSLLKKFRLTPNIRIKYAKELEDNIGRGLDTALPHSDAWVEGPWGMNCHVPLFGDTERNYLHFYKLKNENEFSDSFLNTSATYNEMQWVMQHYEDDIESRPFKNQVNLSDYALIHKTKRMENAGTRVSIDTTVFAGDHDVHPDRTHEYMDYIPRIGEDLFIKVKTSEEDDPVQKKSIYSHYTTGSLERIYLDDSK